MADPAPLFARWLASLEPPAEPRPLLEFARALRLPDGPLKGRPYDPDGHPAQREYLRAYESGRWSRFAVIGPTQDGKSWCVCNVVLAWTLCERGEPAIVGLPDEAMAGAAWLTKIRPAMAASGLRSYLPQSGAGSRGGSKAGLLRFSNGSTLIFAGGGGKNESAQAGRTAPLVLVDEVDSFRDRPHILPLFDRRADAYGSEARRVRTTTIKSDRASLILEDYHASSQGRLWSQCPVCGTWQTLEWDRVTYDPTSDRSARATARIACAGCAVAMDDDARRAMVRGARLVMRGQVISGDGAIDGPEPECDTWGLRWSALDSPLRSLGDLAALHRQAAATHERTGWHHDLRQFWRDQLALPYLAAEEEVLELVDSRLHERAQGSDYRRGQVPAWATRLTLGQDIQLRRHYWLAVAHADDGRWAVVDWGRHRLTEAEDEAPGAGARREALERVHTAVVGREWPVPFSRAACDVGYQPQEVRPWLAKRRLWLGVRGAGSDQVSRMKSGDVRGKSLRRIDRWIDVREDDDWPDRMTGFVDSDSVLDEVALAWGRGAGAPGAGHLPVDADDDLIRHLVGMRPSEKDSGPRWVQRWARHDYLDCLVYALAVARLTPRKTGPARTYGVVGKVGA